MTRAATRALANFGHRGGATAGFVQFEGAAAGLPHETRPPRGVSCRTAAPARPNRTKPPDHPLDARLTQTPEPRRGRWHTSMPPYGRLGAQRALRERGAYDRRGASLRTTSATAATITAAPATVTGVITSPSTSQPSTIATTGFTYAYVATLPSGAFCSSQA